MTASVKTAISKFTQDAILKKPGTDLFGPSIGRPTATSALVAERLQSLILDKKLKPGMKLPSERSLCEQLGVSRTVLREAIKLLSPSRMLEEIPGKGMVVSNPNFEAVKNSLRLCLRWHVESCFDNLIELRRLVEVEVAGLAAVRATKKQIEELRRNIATMEHMIDGCSEAFAKADYDFHRGLAEATQNKLFVIVLDALSETLVGIWEKLCQDVAIRRHALTFHKKILAAIVHRDSREARRTMRENLRCYAHEVENECDSIRLGRHFT